MPDRAWGVFNDLLAGYRVLKFRLLITTNQNESDVLRGLWQCRHRVFFGCFV